MSDVLRIVMGVECSRTEACGSRAKLSGDSREAPTNKLWMNEIEETEMLSIVH